MNKQEFHLASTNPLIGIRSGQLVSLNFNTNYSSAFFQSCNALKEENYSQFMTQKIARVF